MEMLTKHEIRTQIKAYREQLDEHSMEAWDEQITRKVLELSQIRQAFCVYCYVSFHHEAGTGQLIQSLLELGKYVAVPKVAGRRLEFYVIHSPRELAPGVMGIPEPLSTCLQIQDRLAPVIVPGIAFDRQGRRIGYGGGYYDRFFEAEPDHPRFGLAYEFQIFDAVPVECHDRGMDAIITP